MRSCLPKRVGSRRLKLMRTFRRHGKKSGVLRSPASYTFTTCPTYQSIILRRWNRRNSVTYKIVIRRRSCAYEIGCKRERVRMRVLCSTRFTSLMRSVMSSTVPFEAQDRRTSEFLLRSVCLRWESDSVSGVLALQAQRKMRTRRRQAKFYLLCCRPSSNLCKAKKNVCFWSLNDGMLIPSGYTHGLC